MHVITYISTKQIELYLLPGNPDPCNLLTVVTPSDCCLHHACQFMVVISLNTRQLCEYVLDDHCQNTDQTLNHLLLSYVMCKFGLRDGIFLLVCLFTCSYLDWVMMCIDVMTEFPKTTNTKNTIDDKPCVKLVTY